MDEEEDVLKAQEDGLRADIVELKAQIEENELVHGIPSKGMRQITKEYLDSSSRAHRLASTREGLLANSDYGIEDVSVEDYQIYLKHMISHLQSLSYINQVLNKTKVDSGKEDHSLDDQGQQDNAVFDKSSKSDEKVKTTLNKHTDKEGKPNYSYLNDDDDNDGDLFTGQKDSNIKVKENEAVHETTGNIPTDTGTGTRQDMNDENLAQPLKEDKNKTKLISFVTDKKSITVHQKEAASENKSTSSSPQQPQCHFHFAEHIPQPPVMMQATANLLLAATGGGITTDEKSSGLPLHANDLETLRPHLILLCYAYNIQMVRKNFSINLLFLCITYKPARRQLLPCRGGRA
ncbi:unnamed protein product [Trichobilharzia regenti]|nr:unnamed protein product [Trichobilharzia regenti]